MTLTTTSPDEKNIYFEDMFTAIKRHCPEILQKRDDQLRREAKKELLDEIRIEMRSSSDYAVDLGIDPTKAGTLVGLIFKKIRTKTLGERGEK